MSIEPIGVLTFLAALLVFWRGPDFGIFMVTVSTLLGAAAALKLPSLGGASILPAHIIMMAYTASVLRQSDFRARAVHALSFPNAGFWLGLVVIFGVIGAIFLPRIFAQQTYVFSLARAAPGEEVGIVTSYLEPRASNITQAAYLAGDLVCFMAVAAHAMSGGLRCIVAAVLVAASCNLFFAVADLVTYATGTAEVLSIIRNASYRILDSGAIFGFKRIVGSFAEASAYGYATIGFFAFSLELWLRAVQPRITGPLAALSGATLIFITSSSAYAATAVFLLFIYVRSASELLSGRASRQTATLLLAVPLGLCVALLAVMLIPSAWQTVSGLFEATVATKLSSQSGVERMRWNEQALQSFVDTATFGAGVGSVRASSFAVAVLANMGLTGALLFAVFLASIVGSIRYALPRSENEAIASAGAAACLILLVAACAAGASVDLGLPFFVFAAVAATGSVTSRAQTPGFARYPTSHRPRASLTASL